MVYFHFMDDVNMLLTYFSFFHEHCEAQSHKTLNLISFHHNFLCDLELGLDIVFLVIFKLTYFTFFISILLICLKFYVK